ncbi:hypothetical protein GQ53DRAFT_651874 [Thozetella sp. PMI_491]|nr:hypothetical protein GQ53DRAFT_651874 [Thozetella sp. PMI_491]
MSGSSSSPAVAYLDPGADAGSDGRKQKRELSQSKRAAQNRAAQRAFRQRKEGYIKKLEQQVKEADDVKTSYQSLQAENEHLRMYVIDLQSRLIDLQGNYPPPPPSINLAHPRAIALPPPTAQQSFSGPTTASLAAVAQAVEGMTSDGRDSRADAAREADEISRQLKGEPSDGLVAAPM